MRYSSTRDAGVVLGAPRAARPNRHTSGAVSQRPRIRAIACSCQSDFNAVDSLDVYVSSLVKPGRIPPIENRRPVHARSGGVEEYLPVAKATRGDRPHRGGVPWSTRWGKRGQVLPGARLRARLETGSAARAGSATATAPTSSSPTSRTTSPRAHDSSFTLQTQKPSIPTARRGRHPVQANASRQSSCPTRFAAVVVGRWSSRSEVWP